MTHARSAVNDVEDAVIRLTIPLDVGKTHNPVQCQSLPFQLRHGDVLHRPKRWALAELRCLALMAGVDEELDMSL